MTVTVPAFDPVSVRHVLTARDFAKCLSWLRDYRGVLVVDIESTGVDPWAPTARVVTLSFTDPETGLSHVIGLSHPDVPLQRQWRSCLRDLAETLLFAGVGLVAHHASFDIGYIWALTGVNLAPLLVADTELSVHLLDENQNARLKDRCESIFGIERWDDFDMSALDREGRKADDGRLMCERVSYFQLAMYNARDTYWTWRLWEHNNQLLFLGKWADEEPETAEEVDLWRLGQYYTTVGLKTIRTLIDIEHRGFTLDQDWCNQRRQECLTDIETSTAELERLWHESERAVGRQVEHEFTGSWEPTTKFFQAWAELMCESGNLRVTARTGTGKPSWNKEVLDDLAHKGFPAAQTLRDRRIATKTVQFLDAWQAAATFDGRIRSNYHYTRVVTGRLSASDPNLQQIPRSERGGFVSSPGTTLLVPDYATIEMRIAAFLADCGPMKQAFADGLDVHTFAASVAARVPYEQVDEEQRQRAKASNFGFLFGMMPKKFVDYAWNNYKVAFTLDEATEIREAFFSTWDGIRQWHSRVERQAWEDGQVISPLGRIRRVPNIHSSDDWERMEAARLAINSPVQGMASDIMCLATHRIRTGFPNLKPLALIHDAVVVECPDEALDAGIAAVQFCMEKQVVEDLRALGCDLTVPLKADVKFGKSWGDLKKV